MKRLLIDSDFRMQMLDSNVSNIDSIIYAFSCDVHGCGSSELLVGNMKKKIIKERFPYLWR